MKNKDPFKELLHQYQVPSGKESEISMAVLNGQKKMSHMVHTKTPLDVLLRNQARFISPYLWVTQIFSIILTILFIANSTEPNFEIKKILFSVIPLLAIFTVPELIKSTVYGISELELACKNSISKILLTRLFIIGCINLVALTIIITFVSIQYSLPFSQIALYGLVPFNIVTGINLLMFHFVKIRSSTAMIIISLGLIVLLKLITELSFFTAISQTMWIILFVSTTLFLLAEIYYFISCSITKKEVMIQWN